MRGSFLFGGNDIRRSPPREALDLFGSYYPKRRGTEELLALVQGDAPPLSS